MSSKQIVIYIAVFLIGFLSGVIALHYQHKCQPAKIERAKCLPPAKPVNNTFGATTSALLENVERLKRCSAGVN